MTTPRSTGVQYGQGNQAGTGCWVQGRCRGGAGEVEGRGMGVGDRIPVLRGKAEGADQTRAQVALRQPRE